MTAARARACAAAFSLFVFVQAVLLGGLWLGSGAARLGGDSRPGFVNIDVCGHGGQGLAAGLDLQASLPCGSQAAAPLAAPAFCPQPDGAAPSADGRPSDKPPEA